MEGYILIYKEKEREKRESRKHFPKDFNPMDQVERGREKGKTYDARE